MLTVQLPPDLAERIVSALRRAGSREIGGVLLGEHLGPSLFRIADMSIQRSGGTRACFVRKPQLHAAYVRRFFKRTRKAYKRFNYLGEWHSHPCFPVSPSDVDVAQMQEIVEDGPEAPHFAVLVIVRLFEMNLRVSAHSFRPNHPPVAVNLVIAERPREDPALERPSLLRRWIHRIRCEAQSPSHNALQDVQ